MKPGGPGWISPEGVDARKDPPPMYRVVLALALNEKTGEKRHRLVFRTAEGWQGLGKGGTVLEWWKLPPTTTLGNLGLPGRPEKR